MWVLYGLLWPNQEIRNIVVYPVTEACAVAAEVVGVLRYRPSSPAAWLLIAGGFATYLVGDLIWAVSRSRSGGEARRSTPARGSTRA
jgi:hypothetical protein